jgi:hypothetical protein
MALIVWLLTTADDQPIREKHIDIDHLRRQVRAEGRWFPEHSEITFLGITDLFKQFNEESGTITPIPGYAKDWDIWRYSIFRQCLGEARRWPEHEPALIEHGSTWTAALGQDILEDITPLARDRDVVATFMNRVRLSCQPEPGCPGAGRYFALPFTVDARLMFYRKAAFQQMGERSDCFRNWGSFQDRVMRYRKRNPDRLLAVLIGQDAFHDALPYIWASGGDIIRASDLQPRLASEETLNGIMRLVRLALSGVAPLSGPPETRSEEAPFAIPPETQTDAEEAMLHGRLDAGLVGYWFHHRLAREGKAAEFGATLPPSDQYRVSFVGGTNLGIVRRCHPLAPIESELAKDLLQYLCLDDYVVNHYRVPGLEHTPAWKYNWAIGKLPPQLRVWQGWQRDLLIGTDEHLDPLGQALLGPDHLRLPSIPRMAEIEESLKETFVNLWKAVREEDQKFRSELGLSPAPDLIPEDRTDKQLEVLVARCSEIVKQCLNEANKTLKLQLRGLVRVRKREASPIGSHTPNFVNVVTCDRSAADDQFFRKPAPQTIVVDEDWRECMVNLGSGPVLVPFPPQGESLEAILLKLARSDKGKIDPPVDENHELDRREDNKQRQAMRALRDFFDGAVKLGDAVEAGASVQILGLRPGHGGRDAFVDAITIVHITPVSDEGLCPTCGKPR